MTRKSDPLHLRIGADIEQRIHSGEWAPGHRVPTEAELMAQYDCARMTVSRALSDLAGRGLVVRRKRAGTVVAHPPVHSSAVVDIPDIQAEVTGRGLAYRHRQLNRVQRPATEAEDWMATDGGLVLELETLHYADDEPFVLERRLISLAAAPEAGTADFAVTPPGSWLLAQVPWTGAEHRIAAVAADHDTARRLELDPGAACLRLERRTWREGRGVTWASQTFPGAAYELVARFSPARSRSP
ncbi:histidine utilization repressor [Brevundimonas vesicularis]|uniref:histidine utilization repressor n=1 Tax=Brevundimonas vesicularis TaxID=41276 RepID=UPI0038D44EB4